MKLEVIGKNGFNPSQANKEFAAEKLAKLQHLFNNHEELDARVVCKVYKEFHKVEITIPTKNIILRAEATDTDMYSALDKAIEKLVTQIKKSNSKNKNKDGKEGIKEIFSDNAFDAKALEKEIIASQLVKSKSVELTPMTVEDAIDQMELLGHDFFIFMNKDNNNQVCVIYVREDGDYAVIETK